MTAPAPKAIKPDKTRPKSVLVERRLKFSLNLKVVKKPKTEPVKIRTSIEISNCISVEVYYFFKNSYWHLTITKIRSKM